MICPFSDYELRVILWCANGNECKQIADIEGRSTSSVKRALERARDKVSAKTTAHLVSISIKNRWIRSDQIYQDGGKESTQEWLRNISRIVSVMLLVTVTYQDFIPSLTCFDVFVAENNGEKKTNHQRNERIFRVRNGRRGRNDFGLIVEDNENIIETV